MPDDVDPQQVQHQEIRQLLSRPVTYPDRPRQVQLIETHISSVFVTDYLVYKLKKPVHFEFVDFRTLAAREEACQAEIRLNRRLAPDVYLGLRPITRAPDGTLALDGNGETVDWVVEMQRLPVERTLDSEIRAGRVPAEDVAALSQLLGDFYARAERAPLPATKYRHAIERHVRANCAELLSNAATDLLPIVRRAHVAQLQFLRLRADLFDARVAEDRIIDGHGDLRPEHICLTKPPVIFDCLEFDARLRHLDLADELSFLAMECERLGAPVVGRAVRDSCLARCGDRPPPALLAFYQSYRACVRAKVAALRARQSSGDAQATAARETTEYVRLAARYLPQFTSPLLVIVSGLMGSGKSTLARGVAEALACENLQTDAMRRELLGASEQPAPYNAGPYSTENRQRVYDSLFAHVEQLLRNGDSVLVDGTFLRAAILRRAATLATSAGVTMLIVRCRCPQVVARARIAARLAAGGDPSEARPELYQRQQSELQPIPAEIAQVEIDTTRAGEEQLATVIARLRTLVQSRQT